MGTDSAVREFSIMAQLKKRPSQMLEFVEVGHYSCDQGGREAVSSFVDGVEEPATESSQLGCGKL